MNPALGKMKDSRPQQRLLFVDDNAELAGIHQDFFSRRGFVVDTANTETMARNALASRGYAAMVFDLNLGDGKWTTGMRLAATARTLFPTIPIFLLTAVGDPDVLSEARRVGIDEVLFKPTPLEVLAYKVRAQIAIHGGDAAGTHLGSHRVFGFAS